MELQAKERAQPRGVSGQNAWGLYVHVPFCASQCRYCAFYKTPPLRAHIARYLEAVRREWAGLPLERFDTCFFGGGTPGVLTGEDFAALARDLRARGFAPREWTVELSPETATPRRLEALRQIGVNRVSMGVQSFDDALLRALGRRATAARARAAIRAIRDAGFENFNLDLMIALPGQSPEALLRDLTQAAAESPAHISTYCLTLEDDAPLLAALRAQGYAPDIERERDCYLAAWETLPKLGYAHYEVSNFARKGRECVHNLNTWRMQNWVGCGPSAASQIGLNRRANVADLEKWARGVLEDAPVYVDERALTAADMLADCLIFGLRLCAGVNLDELAERFGREAVDAYAPLWRNLARDGLLDYAPPVVRLTTEGLMLADSVAQEILS